tara:strand:+ start:21192 stop:21419 length:228 start_codon:yes stop_codon:yes gene_type:complete
VSHHVAVGLGFAGKRAPDIGRFLAGRVVVQLDVKVSLDQVLRGEYKLNAVDFPVDCAELAATLSRVFAAVATAAL